MTIEGTRAEAVRHSPDLRAYLVGRSVEPMARGDDIVKAVVASKNREQFVWVHLMDPDERTVREACEALGIHPIATADMASGRQQPKVQKYQDHLFVVLWNVSESVDDGGPVLGQTYLYIGENSLLSLQRPAGGKATDLRVLLGDTPDEFRGSAVAAGYMIMADIVNGYTSAAADVEDDLEELEEQVFNDSTTEDHRRIYELRKQIGRIDRAVSSISAALRESTAHLDAMTLGDDRIVPYLYDLLDDAAGTAALLNNQSRALDAVLSSHENNVSARQNKDMRTISAFAALLALPTLIAGVYGMNFKNIPLVQWQYGWLAIGGAIVVIDVIIYLMFKRRHWL